MPTIRELLGERAFLLSRSQDDKWGRERWTGISSDHLVAVAFGLEEPRCNHIGRKASDPAYSLNRGSGWVCNGWLSHSGPHHSGAEELVESLPAAPPGYPHDPSDLASCERCWMRLPDHLQTPKARKLLEAFREGVERDYPNALARVQGHIATELAMAGARTQRERR